MRTAQVVKDEVSFPTDLSSRVFATRIALNSRVTDTMTEKSYAIFAITFAETETVKLFSRLSDVDTRSESERARRKERRMEFSSSHGSVWSVYAWVSIRTRARILCLVKLDRIHRSDRVSITLIHFREYFLHFLLSLTNSQTIYIFDYISIDQENILQ